MCIGSAMADFADLTECIDTRLYSKAEEKDFPLSLSPSLYIPAHRSDPLEDHCTISIIGYTKRITEKW